MRNLILIAIDRTINGILRTMLLLMNNYFEYVLFLFRFSNNDYYLKMCWSNWFNFFFQYSYPSSEICIFLIDFYKPPILKHMYLAYSGACDSYIDFVPLSMINEMCWLYGNLHCIPFIFLTHGIQNSYIFLVFQSLSVFVYLCNKIALIIVMYLIYMNLFWIILIFVYLFTSCLLIIVCK